MASASSFEVKNKDPNSTYDLEKRAAHHRRLAESYERRRGRAKNEPGVLFSDELKSRTVASLRINRISELESMQYSEWRLMWLHAYREANDDWATTRVSSKLPGPGRVETTIRLHRVGVLQKRTRETVRAYEDVVRAQSDAWEKKLVGRYPPEVANFVARVMRPYGVSADWKMGFYNRVKENRIVHLRNALSEASGSSEMVEWLNRWGIHKKLLCVDVAEGRGVSDWQLRDLQMFFRKKEYAQGGSEEKRLLDEGERELVRLGCEGRSWSEIAQRLMMGGYLSRDYVSPSKFVPARLWSPDFVKSVWRKEASEVEKERREKFMLDWLEVDDDVMSITSTNKLKWRKRCELPIRIPRVVLHHAHQEEIRWRSEVDKAVDRMWADDARTDTVIAACLTGVRFADLAELGDLHLFEVMGLWEMGATLEERVERAVNQAKMWDRFGVFSADDLWARYEGDGLKAEREKIVGASDLPLESLVG